jgi:hypothetical protein
MNKIKEKCITISKAMAILFLGLCVPYTLFAIIHTSFVGYERTAKINNIDCDNAKKVATIVNDFVSKNHRIPTRDNFKGNELFLIFHIIPYESIQDDDALRGLDAISPPPAGTKFPFVIMDGSNVPLIWVPWSNKCNKALTVSEMYFLGSRGAEIAAEIIFLLACIALMARLRKKSN